MFDLGRLLATVAACVVWFQLTVHLGDRICNQLTPRFRTYSTNYQFVVKCRLNTFIYAIYGSLLAISTFLWDESIHKDHIRGYSTMCELNMLGVLVQTATDSYCMPYFAVKPRLMKQHHFLVMATVLASIRYEVCAYFVIFRVLAEISTPFLTLLPLIKDLDLGGARVRLANGLISVVTFFLCRVATIPFYYSEMFKEFRKGEMQSLNSGLIATWLLGGALLDLINLVWFYEIIRGAVKVLTKKDTLTDIQL